jgi:8-oxo-dGTP pyrophosphatase MutT (NUDIX family)
MGIWVGVWLLLLLLLFKNSIHGTPSIILHQQHRTIKLLNMTPTFIIADSAKPFDIPLGDLCLQYPGKRLVVGVAIVSFPPNDSSGSQRKLLLLQRAKDEFDHPLMYELPGGNAEPDDSTLLSTVVREAEEETGLSVTHIWGTFPGFEYETSKGKAIQFNFLAGVEAGTESNIRIDPEEHCAFAWVDNKDDLSSRYPMTENMSRVVSDALNIIEETILGMY